LPARAANLYGQNLDLRDRPRFVIHGHAESITHPQRAWSKRLKTVLHHGESDDAGVHHRIDGEHRKIAHVTTPANTSGHSTVIDRDCIFFLEERARFQPERKWKVRR
jgi:hypothetical protein